MNPLIAAAGEVLFLLLSPIWVVFAGYTLGYAAHSLLVVIEQTAVGFDRVVWPEDRIIDWYWKPFYVYGLLAFWIGVIGALLVPLLHLEAAQEILATAVLVWLIWPVSLLSSLTGSTRLLLLRWEVAARLGRHPLRLLTFYLTAALLPWPFLIAAWFAVSGFQQAAQSLLLTGLDLLVETGSLLVGLPLAGALAAAGWLMYARMLGRLAWLVQLGGRLQEEEAAESEEEVVEAVEVSHVPAPPVEPLPTSGPEPAAVGADAGATYALAEEPAPTLAPEALPFRWEPGRMPPAAPPRSAWRDLPEPPPDPDERHDKPQRLPPGRLPPLLCRQVLHFPWYRTSIRAWVWLSLGLGCVALLLRLQMTLR